MIGCVSWAEQLRRGVPPKMRISSIFGVRICVASYQSAQLRDKRMNNIGTEENDISLAVLPTLMAFLKLRGQKHLETPIPTREIPVDRRLQNR
jgi:hypothetical protein